MTAPAKSLTAPHKVISQWEGKLPFQTSLTLQENLKNIVKQYKKKNTAYFLGFEPLDNIITKGLRTTKEDVLWSAEKLKNSHIKEIELKRGGQATLHSPGQLIIYPILPINNYHLKVKDFILSLERITQELLSDLKIPTSNTEKYAGLSTKKGKIAFFGIHISEEISQHGVSINIENDLELFQCIKSCGLAHRTHDKLSNYNSLTAKQLFNLWTQKAEHFLNKKMGYSSVG